MKTFKNYRGEQVKLDNNTFKHIQERHPEILAPMIRDTLKDPDEVRESTWKKSSELFYLLRKGGNFTCVVVKICDDGIFVSTAMTISKPKIGAVIYKKENS